MSYDEGGWCPKSGAGWETTAKCHGLVRALNCPADVCCPSSSWSNLTYIGTKGDESWGNRNEKRVRHALNLLLFGPPEVAKGFSSWLESYAWDKNATLPPELLDRVTKAAVNYHLIFPKGRWVGVKSCVPEVPEYARVPCNSSGYWPCWKVKPSGGVSQEARLAIESVVGQRLPDAYVEEMKKKGGVYFAVPGEPAFIDPFRKKWSLVSKSVPGSEFILAADTLPTIDQLVKVVDGVVQPTTWLTSFLDVFAPIRPMGRLVGPRPVSRTFLVVPGTAVLSAATVKKLRPLISHDETIEQEGERTGATLSTGAKVAIGVAALALVAGVVLVRRRK